MAADERQIADRTADIRQPLTRRGILAAARAVVAGIVAKGTSVPVAADGATWTLPYTGSFQNGYQFSVALDMTNTDDFGTAVKGTAKGGFGVKGIGTFAAGTGVQGIAMGSGDGVDGSSTSGYGVSGASQTGIGVYGTISGSGSGAAKTAIKGEVRSGVTGANTIGVFGNNQSPGANGHGVVGQSASGYGVLGYTTGGSASLSGISTNANIPAFAGGNSVAGGLAASFAGTVYVNGAFVVADMTQKHGLLKHPDGSYRLMYTVEAPESWAEDFGTGTLTNGKADVKLDPDFAALIHTEDYHVFVTEADGGHHHLSVNGKSGTSFTVTADTEVAKLKGKQTSELNGTFSWRVVARPKSDKKVERLGKFVVPNVPLPDLAKLPKPETPPEPKKPSPTLTTLPPKP